MLTLTANVHWRHTAVQHTHIHTRLTALCPGLPRWAGTRKVKPIWILLKQEAVSGSGISWAICKSAPCSRQITMPAPHRSVFYRPDALPAAQPTESEHWRQYIQLYNTSIIRLSTRLYGRQCPRSSFHCHETDSARHCTWPLRTQPSMANIPSVGSLGSSSLQQ